MPMQPLSFRSFALREHVALQFTVKPLGGYGCVLGWLQGSLCQILRFMEMDLIDIEQPLITVTINDVHIELLVQDWTAFSLVCRDANIRHLPEQHTRFSVS